MDNQIHLAAQAFRAEKIKEVLSKENPSEMEIEIVNRWAEMFGRNL